MKYKIGDEVKVKNGDYYGGDGKIRRIEQWKNGKMMMAIYFSGKGTVWFEKSSEFITKAPRGMFKE